MENNNFETTDKNLVASLLTFKNISFKSLCKKNNKFNYTITYKDKEEFVRLLEQHLNHSLCVDFEKYKQQLTKITDLEDDITN